MVTKGDTVVVGRDGLGVWDGNVVKLGCDDGCTTVNIIKFTELRKRTFFFFFFFVFLCSLEPLPRHTEVPRLGV